MNALLRRTFALLGWTLALSACARDGAELARQRALTAEMEGRSDLARGFWGEVVLSHPDDLPALRSAALAWLRGTQISTSEGLIRLDRYLVRMPGDMLARREGVEARLLTGNWTAAYAEATHLPESEAETHALRARALMASDAAAARAAIDQALLRAPDLPYIHLLAAEIAYELDDFAAVEGHALQALGAGPTRLRAAYLLGRSALREGDREGAERWLGIHRQMRALLGEGSAAAPSPREGLALLADLEAQLGESLPDLRLLRVRWWLAVGDLGQAEVLARELAPALTPDELGELGRSAYAAKRGRLARELFEHVQRLAPLDPGAATSLALLDLDEGAPEAARGRLVALLAGRSAGAPCARCEVVLARAEQRLGNEAEGLDRLRRAVRWAPWKREWVEELARQLELLGRAGERQQVLADLERFAAPSPQ
ncbi:MAG: hypothetical protein KBF21_02280 [Thermoanaerobaculia bacterium]|nr:hypothetical protein [Thermoanaerobaculia bacterium]MBP9823027.1 hypothetical protein [Thermoanaerobaculia bacterium]